MTAETVAELNQQIENKLSVLQELRRDLRELKQELSEEIERLEGTEELARHGSSIKLEETEWDIQCTESAIRGTSKELNSLKSRLNELNNSRADSRIASE